MISRCLCTYTVGMSRPISLLMDETAIKGNGDVYCEAEKFIITCTFQGLSPHVLYIVSLKR